MGRGRSGARKTGGGKFGGVSASEFPSPVKPLKASDLPPITGGNHSQNEAANKIRKSVAQSMINYAITQDSNGRPISKEYAANAVFKTKQEQFSVAKENAQRMSFGNNNLLPQKMNAELKRNADINARYERATNFIKSSSKASFWNDYDGSRNYNDRQVKDYIDGKTKKPKTV